MEVFIVQLYGHFVTGRTSFIQWMFSKEGLGEQWGSRAAGRRAQVGGLCPGIAGREGGGYGTVEQQADWLRLGGQGREPTHRHILTAFRTPIKN
jgi:hypothetical protein